MSVTNFPRSKWVGIGVLLFTVILVMVDVQNYITTLQVTGIVEEKPTYRNVHATNVSLKKASPIFVPTAFKPVTSEVVLGLMDNEKASERNCSKGYGLQHKNRTCTLSLLQEYEATCGYFPTQGKWTNQKAGFPNASFQLDICTLPKPGES